MRKTSFILVLFLAISLLFSCSGTDDEPESSNKIASDVLFMMYMDGDNDLNNYAWANIKNTQKGLMDISPNASVTVLALVDGIDKETFESINFIGDPEGKSHLLKLGAYTQAEYEKDELLSAASIDFSKSVDWVFKNGAQEVDMSSGETLYNFLSWANSKYSASKTILVLNNHGEGPYDELKSSFNTNSTQASARCLCEDETNGGEKHLSTTDVATAINKTFGKIDLLVEDACLQCSIEEIYGLKAAVHYLVASPNTTLATRLDYDRIIPAASTGKSILEIGKKIVDFNYEECSERTIRHNGDEDGPCYELSLNLIDCSQTETIENIKKHTSALADAIIADESEHTTLMKYLGKLSPQDDENFYGFYYEATFVYTQDLGVTAYLLANTAGISNTSVKTAAQELYNDLKNNSLNVYAWAGGYDNPWYYSGDSSYGQNFLKITDGSCPWGISITCGRKLIYTENGFEPGSSLENYKDWATFAENNSWATLLATYKNEAE